MCAATRAGGRPSRRRQPGYAPRSNTARACVRCARTWSQQQFVPYARVREVVADLFGAAPSVGTLVNLVRQGAEQLVGVEQEIKAALRQASVLHHDETGLRVVGAEGARLEWTHVTCTPTSDPLRTPSRSWGDRLGGDWHLARLPRRECA